MSNKVRLGCGLVQEGGCVSGLPVALHVVHCTRTQRYWGEQGLKLICFLPPKPCALVHLRVHLPREGTFFSSHKSAI